MIDDPELEKLNALTAQIKQAEGKPMADDIRNDVKPMKMSNIGFDFLGAVLVCTFLGWLLDKTLGIKPWGLLSMMLMGFIVGIANVWRALAKTKTD